MCFSLIKLFEHLFSLMILILFSLRFDEEHTQDEEIHLDCFCSIAGAIEVFILLLYWGKNAHWYENHYFFFLHSMYFSTLLYMSTVLYSFYNLYMIVIKFFNWVQFIQRSIYLWYHTSIFILLVWCHCVIFSST